ncbi:MAG: hypothetical protein ABJZ55_16535 [Fuerstiella sp.]
MKSEISKRIAGRVKIAKKRLERDRKTRFRLASKKRSVAEGYCVSWLCDRKPQTGIGSLLAMEKRKEIESAIDRFTTNERYRELIRRRLFDGESIKDSAEDLGVVYQSARRKMMEAKRFLQAVL